MSLLALLWVIEIKRRWEEDWHPTPVAFLTRREGRIALKAWKLEPQPGEKYRLRAYEQSWF